MALQSQRDEPGTLREYETIYVIRPDAEGEQIRHVNERVQRVIADAEGKLLRVENWGKRKLAYEIKKNTKGIYLYWRFLAGPQLIFELERNLRMLDTVLRYMTVKIDEDIDPNARPSDVTDETLEAASETAPDEEDLFLRMGGRSADEGEAPAEAKPADETADDKTADEAEPAEAPKTVKAADEAEQAEAPETTEAADEAKPAEAAAAETTDDEAKPAEAAAAETTDEEAEPAEAAAAETTDEEEK